MNEERLNKLLEDIDNALYDLKVCQCNINVTAKGHKWEAYYGLDDDLIKYIRKIENSNKNLQSKIDKISEYVDKIYDVMDYKDYPPYLDEIYYTLHPELKEDK